jgi:hypothetical protein
MARGTRPLWVKSRHLRRNKACPPTAKADNSRIGIFYVDPNLALTPAQHMRAVWFEFEVVDGPVIAAGLRKLGMRSFDQFNREPTYFQAPGGQVFGIASDHGIRARMRQSQLQPSR